MLEENFQYLGAAKRRAAGTIFLADSSSKKPVLLIAHGFKAFKDWGFFPYLARYFASKGMFVVTFNFSHNGCDESGREEADLAAFKENCFSYETQDLEHVHALLECGALPQAHLADASKIHLLGHSRGGASIIECANLSGVKSLILLASISRYPTLSIEEQREWREQGVRWVENLRTKTLLPLGLRLLEDIVSGEHILEERLKSIEVPVCIIHGTEDLTVPAKAARELSSWAKNSELHLLKGGGHTFEMKHPCLESTTNFEELLRIGDAFLRGKANS